MLPSTFLYSQVDITRQALNAFGMAKQVVLAFSISLITHPLQNYLFVYHWEMKLTGIAISNGLTNSFNLLLLTQLIKRSSVKDAFFMINEDSFQGLLEYFNIGFSSMLMCCLKSWAYSVQNLFASLISPELIAAQSLLHNISRNYYTTSYGLQQAAGAIIGRTIGESDIDKAK